MSIRCFVFLFVVFAEIPLARADPAADKRPNILFVLADDWSYGHAGVYGCSWVKTPNFDRVAKAGILFTHAYTPTGKCAPSRACIVTGRNPWQLKAAADHWCFFPAEFKSFSEALGDHGYTVGMTQKGWAPGVAVDAAGKPRQMTGKPYDEHKLTPPTKTIAPNDYAANFNQFLDEAPAGKPWCFWFGCHEPHRPYEYGTGVSVGGMKLSDIDKVPACWPDTPEVRNDMLDYAYEVEHFDKYLGLMLDSLEKRGLLENTLVVVTSDNGMPFPHDKGQEYNDSSHIPMAVMWKNGLKNPGRVSTDFVSFIDLAPTFIELAGLKPGETGMAPMTGRSLTDELSSAAPVAARDHVLVGRERNDVGRPHDEGYPIRGIVKGDLLYLHNFEPTRWPACNPETGYMDVDSSPTKTAVLQTRTVPGKEYFWKASFGKRGEDEVYNLRDDSSCMTNLLKSVSSDALKAQLFDELKKQDDPRMSGQGHLFDEYPCANPKEKGFFERFMNGEHPKSGTIDSDFEKQPLDD